VTAGRVRALCWAGLLVFTAYLLWVNHDYYQADTQIPTYDEAWYLETSLHLHRSLLQGGLAEWWRAYRGAFGVKAPLLSVLALPFYLVFGPGRETAMLVNSFFVVVASLYLFLLARRLFSPSAGLAAVVFFQTMPLAYGLSRSFMTEYGLAALAIVFLYYLAASDDLTRPRETFQLGIVLGLGLLMKVIFPVFVAGPLLVALYRRRSWEPVFLIGLPALVLASTWYAYNWRPLLAFAFESAYGGIAPDYSAGGAGAWLALVVNQGMSFYYAAAVLILVPIAFFRRRPEGMGFLAAWLVPPVLALAAGRNQLIRFVLPVLPVFAIALAAAVFSLGRSWRTQALLAVALAVYPQRLFAATTYRPHAPAGHAVTLGPFVVFARDLGWARPPVHEDPWEHRRLLEAARRLAPDAAQPFYVVLALDHTYLNANLLNYLNAYENYPVRFTSLGYGESSVDRAIERIYALDARFLLLGEGFPDLPEFLNRVNDGLRARLERGELPFRLRAEVPLAPPRKALLYERDAPWSTAAEAQPSHPQRTDFPGGLTLLGHDWRRRDLYLHELTLYWTARERLRQEYRIRVELPGGALDYLVTGGAYPMTAWKPGQVVRETRTVYLGPGRTGPVEARVSVTPWGAGPPLEPAVLLRLAE
jgi:4-amino-4-deoxy-L-arabinose transferase-like glycosyltransferase